MQIAAVPLTNNIGCILELKLRIFDLNSNTRSQSFANANCKVDPHTVRGRESRVVAAIPYLMLHCSACTDLGSTYV